MRGTTLLTLAASVTSAVAQYKGFNYGSTFNDGSSKVLADFEDEFKTAKALVGTSGFTSARLYTMIQGGTTDTVISAIPAALSTETTLLLGLWASAGQTDFDSELTALTNAISQYASEGLADYVVGISVGSEDLYRDSSTGEQADAGVGAGPETIISYIKQVRAVIDGTALASVKVGHVDTWNAWTNATNSDVFASCDFVGMDAYPYFQSTYTNPIADGASLFTSAYQATVDAAGDVPVWVTETGWPVSGPTENLAVASLANAKTYWDAVGCDILFGKVNTWWYTLQDAYPTTPSPSFGVVGETLSDTPLYDLSCSADSSSSSSASSTSAATTSKSVASATTPTTVPASATSSVSENPVPSASYATSSSVATSAASSVASSVASDSVATTAPSSTVTAITTASSTSVSGDVTMTVYHTTLITITSCSGTTVCTSSTLSTASAPASTAASVTASSAVSSSAVSSSTVSSSTVSSATASASASSCPANLDGDYQYPHLIVPVSSASPSTAYGTSYDGTINSTVSTIFNFDIPESYAGLSCSLIFLFPELADLETSSYTFNGEGGIVSHVLATAATTSTTYANQGSFTLENGSIASLKAGNSYVISSDSCPAGTKVSFELSSTGGLDLEFFEDYNPSPLGLYVRAC